MRKFHVISLFAAFMLLFTSCIGLSIDIRMNRDGSGKLTMEYRISRAIDSIGALDGNKDMPAIPVSRSDWERTINRVPGAKLTSYSSGQKGYDTITTVEIQYDNTGALLALLSFDNSNAAVKPVSNQNTLDLILNDGSLASNYTNPDSSMYDASMIEFARTMFADYNFSISFSAQDNSTLTFTDKNGNEKLKPSSVEAVTGGRRVSMSIGIMDLIESKEEICVRFRW